MTRPPKATLALGAAALALASSTDAQNCYDTDHQCFSFAPQYEGIEPYDTGVPTEVGRFKFHGDIRVRVRMADAPGDAPYNENDQQATRARFGVEFMVNERAHVYVEYVFSETWAGSKAYSDADPANPVNELGQAYLQAEDLFGLGTTLRAGRSTYVLGNGLVLGSCDFLQYPSTFTGAWLSRSFGEHAIEVFALDNYGQLNLSPGTRFAGATGRIRIGYDSMLESFDPFFMAGTGDGDLPSDDSWYGFNTGGVAPAEIGWQLQYAHRNVDGGDDRDAYRAILSREFDSIVDEVSFTRTGADGAMHVNPADFNTAGLLHQYGGAWRSDLDTNQLAVSLAPCENLDVDFNLLTFDGDAATQGDTELDVLVGRQLSQGIYGSIGYGRDNEDRQVGYIQLTAFL